MQAFNIRLRGLPLVEVVVDDHPVRMTPVESSNIRAIGYDKTRELLVCQFHSGSTYVYRRIPPTRYAAFQSAPSKGKYLQQHIVGNHAYPFERLDL